mmetsp:Transcript_28299/g.71820  ORF Transcript_28299/g.71820 Transcript_28299/m.71820 type:complete len:343 (-) Transcript_28299:670-1698(-)
MEFCRKNVITEAAECLICLQNISSAPFETACCGKFACESCAKKYEEDETSECFHCRAPAGKFSMHINKFVAMQLAQEKVKCSECPCRKQMSLDEYREHVDPYFWQQESPCPGTVRNCPHAGCNYAGKLADLKEHLAKACKHGYRKLDALAVKACGGEEGLKKRVGYITRLLRSKPPLSPFSLGHVMADANILLTAKYAAALAGTVYGADTSITRGIDVGNVYVEGDLANPRDPVDDVGHILEFVFKFAQPETTQKERDEVWDAYWLAIRHRVADAYNLTQWGYRDEVDQCTIRKSIMAPMDHDEEKRASVAKVWRKVFGIKSPADDEESRRNRSRSPRRNNL